MFFKGFCQLMFIMVVFVGALANSLPVDAFAGGPGDAGVFRVSVSGKEVGIERFQILSSGNNIIAKAEVEFQTRRAGKSLDLRSVAELVLNSRLRPLSYTWKQKGFPRSRLRIDFTTTPTQAWYHTINGKSDDRGFVLPPNVVVLDDNVLEQYEILVDRYDMTSGGRQAFKAFIPQEALPGQVQVVATGKVHAKAGAKREFLRHFIVTTDLARIDLWTDSQGHLQRVSVPARRFNAVRQE